MGRIDRVRVQVDRMCWTGVAFGLAFTATNVQAFAAGDAVPWSLVWCSAWLLDPTVSVVLVALLRAEQVTARYRVPSGRWVRRAKWLTLAATYVMNTWESYAAGAADRIVLHSVPPLVVFAAAEAITEVRDQLTAAAHRAHREFAEHAERAEQAGSVNAAVGPVNAGGPTAAAGAGDAGGARTSFAEYLVDARAAWTPGVHVTPAWIREVTGCSRGLSTRLARAVTAHATSSVAGVVSGGDRR